MRIEKVEAFPIRIPRNPAIARGLAGSPTATAGEGRYRWSTAYPVLYPVDFETCLVRITLADGRTGWGEAQAPLVPEVPAALVNLLLGPVLTGLDFDGTPARIAELWHMLYSTMRVRGQTGGYQLDAIAGIDIALWDLAGHLAGLPLYRLLGGRTPHVPAYLSGVAGATEEERLAFLADHAARGFTLVKLYLEESYPDLLRRLDRYRAAFPALQFALDALWHLPSPDDALDLDLAWVECPFPPEEAALHAAWARRARAPLALGESYRTRHELGPVWDALTIVQPDLGRCGITETLRIGSEGKRLVPHVSIALAPQILAALHVAAALPHSQLCEYNPRVVEVANRFLADPIRLEGARYLLPDAPGLGLGSFSPPPPYGSANA